MALTLQEQEEIRSLLRQSTTSSSGISDRMQRLRGLVEEPTTQETEEKKGFLGGVGEVLKGVGKGVASTLEGAASLGERGIKSVGRFFTPKSLEKTFGFEKEKKSSAQDLQNSIEKGLGVKTGTLTTPVNNLQKIGFTTEQIAEFFIPGTAGLKVGKAVSTGVKGGKTVQGLARLGATGVAEAGLSAGQTAIQQGEINDEVKTAGLYGLATPAVGAVAGKVLRGVGDVGAEVLGKTTGAGKNSIQEVFNNPNVIKFAREAGSDTDALLRQTAQQAESALQGMRMARGKAYQEQLSKLGLEQKELGDLLTTTKNKLKDLSSDLDTIVEGENVMSKAIKDVEGWSDTSALGLDKLKQRLGSYSEQLIGAGKSKAKRIVDELRVTVKNGLETNVDGYKEMTKGYQEASQMIEDITKSLSLGKTKQTETAVRKFMQTLRRDDDTRREFLEILSARGGKDLTAQIAGALLGPAMPRGLSNLVLGGAGIATLTNPTTVAGLMPVMLATSPRLMAEFTNILGRITKPMIESKTLSVDLQRAVRQLIIQMQDSPNESEIK